MSKGEWLNERQRSAGAIAICAMVISLILFLGNDLYLHFALSICAAGFIAYTIYLLFYRRSRSRIFVISMFFVFCASTALNFASLSLLDASGPQMSLIGLGQGMVLLLLYRWVLGNPKQADDDDGR